MTKESFKTISWNTVKAVAATAAGIVFSIGFMMSVLGWRFTGNTEDIQINRGKILSLELRVTPLEKKSEATLFMLCPIYRKSFPGAPVPAECPRGEP